MEARAQALLIAALRLALTAAWQRARGARLFVEPETQHVFDAPR